MPAPRSIIAPPSRLGPDSGESATTRASFAAPELGIVLSHYDLGVIRSIKPFQRGSRRAPKLRIRTDYGEFMLKRRADGHDDPQRVAFSHELQLLLAEQRFPVARLIGTRDTNNSMLELEGRTYEMFEFVAAAGYKANVAASVQSGRALGQLHRILSGHRSEFVPPVGSYHGATSIEGNFQQVPRAVQLVDPNVDREALRDCLRYLFKAYHDAARRVDRAGYGRWPEAIVHGDWHPGNLLYRGNRVVAVLDFDSARIEPRMSDVANAALQFSMTMGTPDDPADWPGDLDAERLHAILKGYDEGAGTPLTEQERQSLAWLIIEALIVESVVPISRTGRFARLSGAAFLAMIERKVRWVRDHASMLS